MRTSPGFFAAVKRAELLGTLGVLIFGVGVGVWFGAALSEYAWALVVGGVVMHAAGVYGKHRIEITSGVKQPLWYRLLYWLFFGLLVALVVSLIMARG